MKIVFLLVRSALSGGNYVVYQHALFAQQAGHDVTIATLRRDSPYQDAWHPAMGQLKFMHISDAAKLRCDIVFATFWQTALELHRFQAKQYAYFVQSIESRFHPAAAVSIRGLIDAIYGWSLPGLTEASWIQAYLSDHHGSQYHLVLNGIRKDIYRVDGPCISPRQSGKVRILVEGPFGRIKNTARALATARRSGADETWLLTSSDTPWYPGVSKIFSRIPVQQVPPIYRSCDVLVKLSLVEGMFGPPLEMFHCGGTAVVYDVTGHDEYMVDGVNSLVEKMHDEEAVIASIRRIRDDPQLLASLKHGALETAAAWPSWDDSSSKFMLALEALRAAESFPRERLIAEREKLCERFPVEMSNLGYLREDAARPGAMRASVNYVKETATRYEGYFRNIIEGYR